MKLTEIQITLYQNRSLRAFVDIVIDDAFIIHGLKIIQNGDRTFVSMPSRRDGNGSFRDVAHPINSRTRSRMEEQVLTAYQEELRRSAAPQAQNKTRATTRVSATGNPPGRQ